MAVTAADRTGILAHQQERDPALRPMTAGGLFCRARQSVRPPVFERWLREVAGAGGSDAGEDVGGAGDAGSPGVADQLMAAGGLG